MTETLAVTGAFGIAELAFAPSPALLTSATAAGTAAATSPAGQRALNAAPSILSNPVVQSTVQTAQVTINRTVGNGFRDQVANVLESRGFEVAKEAYVSTPFGRRFLDLSVSKSGKLLEYLETKTGGSPYTVEQRAKDMYIKLVKGVRVTPVRQKK